MGAKDKIKDIKQLEIIGEDDSSLEESIANKIAFR